MRLAEGRGVIMIKKERPDGFVGGSVCHLARNVRFEYRVGAAAAKPIRSVRVMIFIFFVDFVLWAT